MIGSATFRVTSYGPVDRVLSLRLPRVVRATFAIREFEQKMG